MSRNHQISTKSALSRHFKMSDLGPCSYWLGMKVSRNRQNGTVSLSQSAYVEKVLKTFDLWDANQVRTPMEPGCQLIPELDLETTKEDKKLYQCMAGSIMYLMLGTRPDIAYAVSVVSRFSSNPNQSHFRATKRILRYLKGTHNYILVLQGPLGDLRGYTDSDWAGDKDTRRSTAGYVFNIGSGAISWSSKRQQTVALSSCEAEYMGQTQASKEAIWLSRLMGELVGEPSAKATIIYGDNQGAIAMAKNPKYHGRAKHIDIQQHWIREWVEDGSVRLKYIPTAEQVADGLTKPLSFEKFERFRLMLGVKAPGL